MYCFFYLFFFPSVGKPSFFCCVVPPSGVGDGIVSTLSTVSSSRPLRSDRPHGSSSHPHVVLFADEVAVEVVTVTDYSEVELGTSAGKEEEEENGDREGDAGSSGKGTLAAPYVEDGEEEKAAPGSSADILPETSRGDVPPGPHDCPDCKKKFKFASSLTAHRVIHTGERPHRCGECGRRFSFRQSLDRHRHTHAHPHKLGRRCGQTFRALSAYSEHGEDGVGTRRQRQRRRSEEFTSEPTPARHQDDDDDDDDGNRTSGSRIEDREAARGTHFGELTRLDGKGQRGGEEITPAKVRTSGRQRKPTMKIQLLKSEEGALRRKKSSSRSASLTLDW